MFSKLWLINAFLVISVIFFGVKIYAVWFVPQVSDFKTGVKRDSSVHPGKSKKRLKTPLESSYDVIVARSLFSPDRTAGGTQSGLNQAKDIKVSGKNIFVYGILLSDEIKKALVTNPFREKGEKESAWVSVGDELGDTRVVDIKRESIVLAKGAQEYELLLYDQDKPKRKIRTLKKVRSTVKVGNTRKQTATQRKRSEIKGSFNRNSRDGKYEDIDTPFGKIKRRIK
jgi:hypothetical protein